VVGPFECGNEPARFSGRIPLHRVSYVVNVSVCEGICVPQGISCKGLDRLFVMNYQALLDMNVRYSERVATEPRVISPCVVMKAIISNPMLLIYRQIHFVFLLIGYG
jgi:hypothetical protein